jgi:hypothetical protein
MQQPLTNRITMAEQHRGPEECTMDEGAHMRAASDESGPVKDLRRNATRKSEAKK